MSLEGTEKEIVVNLDLAENPAESPIAKGEPRTLLRILKRQSSAMYADVHI